MSLNTTTVTSAVGQTDTSIVVSSATGAAAGTLLVIDQEVMKIAQSYSSGTTIPVLRGQDGSVQTSHKASANVTFFLASDEAIAATNVVQFPKVRGRDLLSYSASGAITLPTPGNDMVAILNGTSALAMTLANPTKDLDGCFLYVVGNGKAAHTITYTAGIGNGGTSLDVGTAATGNQCAAMFVAANGIWVHVGLPSATGAANAFLWA
jgi:hypothetical protein